MKQYWALVYMNLAGIPQRLGLVATIVIGVGCAVGVLVSMLAMGAGARREALGNSRPDRAILQTSGTMSSMQSSIPRDVASQIAELPGIRRNAAGKPIAVSQVLVFVQARVRESGIKRDFALNGVTPGLTDYMPELRVTAGRLFKPGIREIIASNVCTRTYTDFAVGGRRTMRGGDWEVVGNFSPGKADGGCVVYADAEVVLRAFSRDSYNQVNVTLQTVGSFAELANAVKANPQMHVEVKHEADFIEDGVKQLHRILDFVSYFVGCIMAAAATLGAANSLYAVVDQRRRDIATLRALGFRSSPIVAAILTESTLLAVPGALLGTAGAWLLFNGLSASPFGFTFHLAVTAPVALIGVTWALAMGLLGGVLPAVRAARVPVTVALRAT